VRILAPAATARRVGVGAIDSVMSPD